MEKPLDSSNSEDAASTTIRNWLGRCSLHEKCQARQSLTHPKNDSERREDRILPSRLLRIEKKSNFIARVIATPSTQDVKYLALSYCWGDDCKNFTTEENTMGEREKGITQDQLPQTILDAITITSNLGISYIWVDALCIIQKDKTDWAKESANMGFIYMNAVLVLSATSSKCPHDGLIQMRDQYPAQSSSTPDSKKTDNDISTQRILDHQIMTFCRGMTDEKWKHLISKHFRLLSRGWAFQERNLATRIVHFTRSELIWECQEATYCECGEIPSSLNNMQSVIQYALNNPSSIGAIRVVWREIVKSYSRRSLTIPNDRLPALSGMAVSFANATGDEYLAGLWRSALPFDLLWRCDQSMPLNATKHRKPSWSWSSVDCGIGWPIAVEPHCPIPRFQSYAYFENGMTGISVLQAECNANGTSKFGHVVDGQIMVEGSIVPTSTPIKQAWKYHNTEWSITINNVSAPFWPDVDVGTRDTPALYFLKVMSHTTVSGAVTEGLVVKSSGSLHDYERVGVACIPVDEKQFGDLSRSCGLVRITII